VRAEIKALKFHYLIHVFDFHGHSSSTPSVVAPDAPQLWSKMAVRNSMVRRLLLRLVVLWLVLRVIRLPVVVHVHVDVDALEVEDAQVLVVDRLLVLGVL
jgi:hypothetical protein